MKDYRGILSYKLYYVKINVFSIFDSSIVRFFTYLNGVQMGAGCKFWGLPLFVRFPNSLIKIGPNCRFRSSPLSNLIGVSKKCIISTHSTNASIIIGRGCGFTGTTIGAINSIKIGENVLFGSNTLITDFDWHNVHPEKRHLPIEPNGRPVVIEDNVFIGYGSTILKGVHIGKNSVIGANSVVVTNIPENVIATGNPARVVKAL